MMLSIVVPVYNVENEINRCIESILNQKIKDFELILIDDGSIDMSGEICDHFSQIDNRIRVIHKNNEGPSKARNCGLDLAIGEWIVFIDADDWIDPDYLEMLSELIMENKADIIQFEHFENNMHIYLGLNESEIYISSDFITNIFTSGSPFGYIWNKAYKKDVIQEIYFDINLKFSEDVLFNYRVFNRKCLVKISCYAGYHHYINRYSLTHNTNNLSSYNDRVNALLKIRDSFDTNISHKVRHALTESIVDCAFDNLQRMSLIDNFDKKAIKFCKKYITNYFVTYLLVSKTSVLHKLLIFVSLLDERLFLAKRKWEGDRYGQGIR